MRDERYDEIIKRLQYLEKSEHDLREWSSSHAKWIGLIICVVAVLAFWLL